MCDNSCAADWTESEPTRSSGRSRCERGTFECLIHRQMMPPLRSRSFSFTSTISRAARLRPWPPSSLPRTTPRCLSTTITSTYGPVLLSVFEWSQRADQAGQSKWIWSVSSLIRPISTLMRFVLSCRITKRRVGRRENEEGLGMTRSVEIRLLR